MHNTPCTYILALSLCIASGFAHEPFDFGKEREWEFLNLAKFRGSLVRLENGKAHIRMADGVVRAFLPGCADGLSGSFLQRAVCQFPQTTNRPDLGVPNDEPLIALSSEDLPDGALSKWRNRGRLGGSFQVLNHSPRVELVNDRKSVVFQHPPWLLPLDFQCMVSDFYLPESVTRGEGLTVAAWLCNQGGVVDRETFLCWGEKDCGELDTPDFSYGCYEALQWYNEKVVLPYARFPKLNQWQQLTFVFSTFEKDKNRFDLKIYVNGEVVATKLLRKPDPKLLSNNHVFVGCAWEAWWGKKWATRPARPYTGAISDLRVYDRALSPLEVAKIAGLGGAYSPSPANESHHVTATTTLSWKSEGHRQFDVYFGRERGAVAARDKSTFKGTIGESTYTPGNLEIGERYFWRVDAKGSRQQTTIWSFVVAQGGAANPEPVTSALNVPTTLEKLRWVPSPDAVSQVLHFGSDPAAVAKGTATAVKLKAYSDEAYIPLELKLAKLERNTTYFWRVEQVVESKDLSLPNPVVWSFKTTEFDLEFDGPVSEQFPSDVLQNGFYSRYMDAGGYPIISPPGNEDIHLRAARFALRKLLIKRPDMLRALQSSHAACHLASQEHRGWGWSHFTSSCYGAGEAILRESAILMHEMGHQFHMNGAEAMEPDFRHRLGEVFNSARRERLWMGDYGGSNMWENAAVCVSWWINDMTQDEGVLTPREMLREGDPRAFHLYSTYWPGDLMVELHPSFGTKLDLGGNIVAWKNRGGIDYFKPNHGWRRYERSVGTFVANGQPKLTTIDRVSAVAFSGTEKMEWDKSTWESLHSNRAWSVDCWIRFEETAGTGIVVSWGTKSNETKLLFGNDASSIVLPGDIRGFWNKGSITPGKWQHITWVFTGGGVNDKEGTLQTYVNGELNGSIQARLSLPKDVTLRIGEGFKGFLGHLRVYNYDLNPLQIAETYARERSAYSRDGCAVASRLLVDLDASQLAPVHDADSWPLYPASLNKARLRSWANSGTLTGKLHNDASEREASQPKLTTDRGIEAITFDGKSHLISSFEETSGKTLEAWIYPEAITENAVILQWRSFCIPSSLLRVNAWQHLVLKAEKDAVEVLIDARSISKLPKRKWNSTRLILGSAFDGKTWSEGLRGSIAELRIHEGILTPSQVQQNFTQGRMRRPTLPQPSDNERVVVERKPTLNWSMALNESESDLYLSTRLSEIQNADRSSPSYIGKKKSGESRPALRNGVTYYWRVDSLDMEGRPLARGFIWKFKTAEGRVMDLNASDFKVGNVVRSWSNNGTAAGQFVIEKETESWQPSVVLRDGRKGVDFSGRKGLVSSFEVPPVLCGAGSFSVSLWAHYSDTRGLEREQTMLSWGRRPKSRAEFCWGSHPKSGAFMGGPKVEFGYAGRSEALDRFAHNAPVPDGWRHFAFTYDHLTHTLKIFADGVLNRQETVLLDINPGELLCLGGVRTGQRVEAPFSGVLDEISIVDKVLEDDVVARLAHHEAVTQKIDWLVRLESAELSEGLLSHWKNSGRLAGNFILGMESLREPVANTVAGRIAVQFDGKALLCSNFSTPPSLTGNTPKSVEMWILNPSFSETETVLALAPSVAMKSYLHETNTCAANYNFGAARDKDRDYRPGLFSTGQSCRNIGWKDAVPSPGEWHHVVWVYSGGYKGFFKVYVDGKQFNERGFFAIDTISGYSMHVGGAWNTARGLQNPFSGAIHSIRVYDYELLESEIQKLSQ